MFIKLSKKVLAQFIKEVILYHVANCLKTPVFGSWIICGSRHRSQDNQSFGGYSHTACTENRILLGYHLTCYKNISSYHGIDHSLILNGIVLLHQLRRGQSRQTDIRRS